MAEQGTHFWFMTVIGRNALGLRQEDYSGHLNVQPGATRFDMFNELRQVIADRSGLADITVIAFDIQPNQL